MENILKGKKGLIMGLSNGTGMAYSILEHAREQGAEVAVSYTGEAMGKRAIPLAQDAGAALIYDCDVTNEEQIQGLFEEVKKEFGKIDFIVHAIAFSDKSELKGKYLNTTEANFLNTMNISCFSFTKAAQVAYNMDVLNDGASLMTLSYLGGERFVVNYNVMGVAKAALEASVKYLAVDLGDKGIRVNSLSAGPIKTLAASGIGEFKKMLANNELQSPLQRNVTTEEVSKTALYLLSDLSSGVTAENIHVDAGFHAIAANKM
jgi:enoyl-[acyl-carrier protein] reductase I